MEMVAASKMRKAQDRMRGAPLCREDAQDDRSPAPGESGLQASLPLERPVKAVGIVVISTDRGLAGG
jgi:F-type H+-transporting ATPase subunit gamma